MLPKAAALLPFLERIDATRWYTNFGPLSREFEQTLARHYQISASQLQLVCNATVGLSLALEDQAGRAGGLCLMPSWTFAATAQAARLAGLQPFFVDVSAEDWALHPAAVEACLAGLNDPVSAVVPVVPFGQALDFAAWAEFRRRTGIAVVVDAAAGFDTLVPTEYPVVVSLDALKAMGIGEGGFIVCLDQDVIARVRHAVNYGFRGRREAEVAGTNAKISEYHCAVGLAHYQSWPDERQKLIEHARVYRHYLARCPAVRMQPGFGHDWISTACLVELQGCDADDIAERLCRQNIGTLLWWGKGCHRHAAFRSAPALALPVTERLAGSVLGLPFFVDMDERTIATVAEAVVTACDPARP
ncbi:MAG: DegT/DnrJ/EryC1/StrS family aminotransferase [Azospirillaceae bacterium]|nr:DegT/DnrJ/EryC1/StrS family aminotransferase [Azospirillaceae bacterium]